MPFPYLRKKVYFCNSYVMLGKAKCLKSLLCEIFHFVQNDIYTELKIKTII